MGKETERKFRVDEEEAAAWRKAPYREVRQGYLSMDKDRTVRVRIAGNEAWLTIKGITRGASRAEYEYPIPIADAGEMLDHLCLRPLIDKRRYRVEHEGFLWEIDEFYEDNAGLIIAEIELESANQAFPRPPWVGAEVTHDPRYYNASLVRHPYSRWKS
ncbi:MAG TPA: CYTH domain-containing protein [Nitrosospira sp.]|jgi:CYTH domain-containing protein|nr:CYTH domain-containing protein [Nitrosospira sp.]